MTITTCSTVKFFIPFKEEDTKLTEGSKTTGTIPEELLDCILSFLSRSDFHHLNLVNVHWCLTVNRKDVIFSIFKITISKTIEPTTSDPFPGPETYLMPLVPYEEFDFQPPEWIINYIQPALEAENKSLQKKVIFSNSHLATIFSFLGMHEFHHLNLVSLQWCVITNTKSVNYFIFAKYLLTCEKTEREYWAKKGLAEGTFNRMHYGLTWWGEVRAPKRGIYLSQRINYPRCWDVEPSNTKPKK